MALSHRVWMPAVMLLLAACSSGHSRAAPGGATTTAPATSAAGLAPEAFADALARGDIPAAQATFAEGAKFYTPVLPDPIVGRAHVIKLVAVLLHTFEQPHIVSELKSPGQFALAFDAHIGKEPIHIFDLITFDQTGHIVTFVSHGRPFNGIRALALAVAPHIPDINR